MSKDKMDSKFTLDDSKMPSPEAVAKFPDTSELDKKFEAELDKIMLDF